MVNRLAPYAQIAGILSKYGFAQFLEELYPEDKRPDFLKKDPDVETQDLYRRIRLAIEELGPTFVKLGQILSVRRDVLPQPLIQELLVLTDDVPPVPYEKVKTIIEETCGDLNEFCIFVDPEPFAAASLSQVHRATLLDGSDVVFKVQRPKIRELIEVDLTILENLAERAEKSFPYLAPFNPKGLIEEFSQQMRKELDFIRDGKNAETIAENLREMTDVKIPKIYWEYSGPRLLVMEYIEGVRIDNLEAVKKLKDLKELAEIGFQAYVHQIFVDGFFHGDPHPGNLRVNEQGQLVFLDFGMVGILRPERRVLFTRILYSIISNDVDSLIDSLDELGIRVKDDELDNFKDDMYTIMKETSRYQLQEYTFIDTINDLSSTLYRYKVRMPGNFMLMIKVVAMIGDIGIQLDPEFNFIQRIQPYLNKILLTNMFNPETIAETRQAITREILSFPKALRKFLENFTTGRSKMQVTIPELTPINNNLENISNRLIYAILSSGLLIGLSIIAATCQHPLTQWQGTLLAGGGLALIVLLFKAIQNNKTE